MSRRTGIEWTDATWNPVTGCDKVSPGCKNCYAERIAKRLRAMNNPRYKNGFELTLHWDKTNEPLKWKSPRHVFVNSMSDLFHKNVPKKFIKEVFETMQQAEHHIFQILTKRAQRLEKIAPDIDWPENVWMGVSVENGDYTWRIDCLRKVNASVRFVSIEPLIDPIHDLALNNIDWIIVGGESGPNARPMCKKWVKEIRNHCQIADVPFFFKQWGGRTHRSGGRELEGRTWDALPEVNTKDKSQITLIEKCD